MPHGQRVVIRSSWPAVLFGVAPVLVILGGSRLMRGYWGEAVVVG